MTDWLLRALGADVEEVDAISAWSLRWQWEPWGVAAVILLAVLLPLSWWFYRKSPQDVKTRRWWFLSLLRATFFALLAGILLQPVLLLTLEREIPRTLPILVDHSASMGVADRGGRSRLEQVRQTFSSEVGIGALDSLEQKLTVPRFTFAANGLEKVDGAWPVAKPLGEKTALGDALLQGLEHYQGASLAGVVLVTDGAQNSGRELAEVGEVLRQAGVPVFAVGAGDPAARNVAIEDVQVRDVLLADDAAPVAVRLRSQGMKGQTGRLVFLLAGVEVGEEEVTFQEDGPLQVRTLFVPRKAGDYTLEVRYEADPSTGESQATKPTGRAAVRVVDRRLRVLLSDQAPRWEYKYLEAMLLRERRVELSCFLFEADPQIARVPGSPYLEQFPLRAEDLFNFDLVILGDIDPHFLTGPQQELLRDYVAKAGGALVVVAGKRFMPALYLRSELARLLPVELSGSSISAATTAATRPVRLDLTEHGRSSVMLQLADDPELNDALWKRLPPVYWTARVARAKPAAEVLLAHPESATAAEAAPVMALHRYGSGEVLFVGTDNFWRWRRNGGDRYHATLWGQIVQRLAGSRLLTESPRSTLTSDRRRYRRGDRVKVFARLFAPNWEPRQDEVVTATLISSEHPDQRREIALRAVPGQPGTYRSEFSAGDPDKYRLALAGDQISTLDFTVRENDRELARAAMNEPLLRELAAQTGGAFFRLEDLAELPAAVPHRSARRSSSSEVALWSSPLLFSLLVLLITVEWIVRKLSELK